MVVQALALEIDRRDSATLHLPTLAIGDGENARAHADASRCGPYCGSTHTTARLRLDGLTRRLPPLSDGGEA
jgi:hypothetical protein